MKYLALCALLLCGCGDGRIERAFASIPASYPVSTTSSDADFDTQMAQLDAESQASKVRALQSQMDDLQNKHPDLF